MPARFVGHAGKQHLRFSAATNLQVVKGSAGALADKAISKERIWPFLPKQATYRAAIVAGLDGASERGESGRDCLRYCVAYGRF